MTETKRLLFFDLLRIGAIAAIVLYHFSLCFSIKPYCDDNLFFNIIYLNEGIIGVAVLIFVSGAVLEYTHSQLNGVDQLSEFYMKRLVRIYPAFWMSLVIGLVLAPYFLQLPKFNLFCEFTGFSTWSGTFGGVINGVGWFIGLIIVLYFLFPFLSASIRKYPYLMLFLITFTEIFTRYFVNVIHFPLLGTAPDRWLPVCNLLEFSLGIFFVQQNFYPKATYDSKIILFLADISFYVLLVHYLTNFREVLFFSPVFYFFAVALFAWFVMLADQRVQNSIKKCLFPLILPKRLEDNGTDTSSDDNQLVAR
jgi:peptidoglycan/LPS O-acetylase OafA/YrhL